MENLVMFGGAYQGKRVWVSGHTGFKGSWLAEWLLLLGAKVHGYSLPPESYHCLFDQLGLSRRLHHETGDIRDGDAVAKSIINARPDFVFHLAAQPLVLESYRRPVETWDINVRGTLHVLEALRRLSRPCAAVIVTTDKCYRPRADGQPCAEDDPLGGHDPYSASKAASEMLVASWRASFFRDHPVRIATARAGNVIGGGDWSPDRILPDCIRALRAGLPIQVRNPDHVRPWQYVLEPLSGYLTLAAALGHPSGARHASAYNFGPMNDMERRVSDVVDAVLTHWPGTRTQFSGVLAGPESTWLRLSTEKSQRELHWKPRWGFQKTVQRTVFGYQALFELDAIGICRREITEYHNG